jgi:ferredoxin-type protein NapF
MDNFRRRFLGLRSTPRFNPPWSLPEALFAERCTRCDDCVKACPTGLLVRGDGGFPVAAFATASCTFCGDCATACTTGAIARTEDQAPWNFGIAIAVTCLPVHGVECRVCGEACDADAIRFRPRIGGAALPEVDNAACSGCGACIAPCPVSAIERIEKPAATPVILASIPLPEGEGRSTRRAGDLPV